MLSMNEEQFNAVLGLYSKKGYKIKKDTEVKDEIPPFLNSLNYYPDYIIRSESTNYIVELSSSKNFDSKQLKKIIEEVENNTAWEFILVDVDINSKVEKPDLQKKSKEDDPDPDIKKKYKKPGQEIKPKDDEPVGNTVQKNDKKDPDFEPEDEQSDLNFELEDEKSDYDSGREEEKPGTNFESISKGYLNLKLMLDSKQFESHPESVLLYGWTLLESMIRKLIEKKQTGTDIGFLLNEAVSGDIIDNSEFSGLKNVYLLRNKLAGGEFGIVTEKFQLEPMIKVVNKLYDNYFS